MPLDEWQDPKFGVQWLKLRQHNGTHTVIKVVLIDVNNDGLMDAMCSNNAVQHYRMTNHFMINKGNMKFDFVTPNKASKWVHWMNN